MAVRYIHLKRVLHRDLKTANVFLNKSGTVCKVGDFGIAKNLENSVDVANTCVGTPCYLAPEMCQDIPYSSKADVWAVGCLLFELLALKPAFDANNLVSLFYKIVKGDHDKVPDIYSLEVKELVSILLCKNPQDRPSAGAILQLPHVKAELLSYLKEKEHILKTRIVNRSVTDRPFSTPTIRSSCEYPGGNCGELLPAGGKPRILSCRPVLVTQEQKVSGDISNRCGRVSTIPEEEIDTDARVKKTPANAPIAENTEDSTLKRLEHDPTTTTTTGNNNNNNNNNNTYSSTDNRSKAPQHASATAKQTDPRRFDNKPTLRSRKLPPICSGNLSEYSQYQMGAPSLPPSHPPPPPPAAAATAAARLAKRRQEVVLPPMVSHRNQIQIHLEITKAPRKSPRKSTNNVAIMMPTSNEVKVDPQRSGRKRSTGSKTRTLYRPDTGRSTITSIGYASSFLGGMASDYSDDFDDSTSGTSTVDEEIPEEITEYRNTNRNVSFSYDIGEIEEDLPDGVVAQDDEELNEAVSVAKQVCDESNMDLKDDIVFDSSEGHHNSFTKRLNLIK